MAVFILDASKLKDSLIFVMLMFIFASQNKKTKKYSFAELGHFLKNAIKAITLYVCVCV